MPGTGQQSWNQVHAQAGLKNTSYYRTRGVPASRSARIETRRRKKSGEEGRRKRGETDRYIARVCLPTYEVNIVTIIIGTQL